MRSWAKLVTTSGLAHDTTYVVATTCRHCPLTLFSQYSWFHAIFAMGAMYVAVLLTDWYVPFTTEDICSSSCHV